MRNAPRLRDVLSRLGYADVKRALGPSCDGLLREGGRQEIDLETQVRLDEKRFTLVLGRSVATIHLADDRNKRIAFACTTCAAPCAHVGAAFSLVLEEKLALGLSAPPL